MSGMDEFFGKNVLRPDTADFWRLSEIVLKYDGRIEAAEDKQQEVDDSIENLVDGRSLSYMALQRAFRVLDITDRSGLLKYHDEVAKLASVYTEAFLIGVEFQKAGGKQ